MWAAFVNLQKQHKVTIHPLGEISPNPNHDSKLFCLAGIASDSCANCNSGQKVNFGEVP
jgi:hypothetical protein